MTYETEEEPEEIRLSRCCYKVEKSGSSPYQPMEYYRIVFWEEEDIEVAVIGGNQND